MLTSLILILINNIYFFILLTTAAKWIQIEYSKNLVKIVFFFKYIYIFYI